MADLKELMAQREKLNALIEEKIKAEKAEALKTVKELCKLHGFTAPMLKGFLKGTRVRKVAVKKDETPKA